LNAVARRVLLVFGLVPFVVSFTLAPRLLVRGLNLRTPVPARCLSAVARWPSNPNGVEEQVRFPMWVFLAFDSECGLRGLAAPACPNRPDARLWSAADFSPR